MAQRRADRAVKDLAPANIKRVAITKIVVPGGRRPLRDITDLAASIHAIGLLQPIILTPKFQLVAGLHRLEACRSLGWVTIPALVLDADRLRKQLVEIDENVMRAELTELERAMALKRRKKVYLALHPETRPVTERGGPGRGKRRSTQTTVFPFAREAAQKLGVSPRTIRRSVQIADGMDPQAASLLQPTPIANSRTDLVRIARMDRALQRDVARLIASGTANNIKAALRKLRWRRVASPGDAPPRGSQYRLFTGDFAVEGRRIDAGSISLLVADPPWSTAFARRFSDLRDLATRTLAPGGRLVLIVGQGQLPGALRSIGDRLVYRWTLCLLARRPKQAWGGHVMSSWTPILVFEKPGGSRAPEFSRDVLHDQLPEAKRDPWEKGESLLMDLVDRYSHPGDQVLDPFCGSGSTGVAAIRQARRFVGIDIDPAAIRLAETQLGRAKWADPRMEPIDSGRLAFPV